MTDASAAFCASASALDSKFRSVSKDHYSKLVEESRRVPRTTEARLQDSLSDRAVDFAEIQNGKEQDETYLYLGYGSNMCALTFLERRQIKPLSQVNVVAPGFQLSFNLPGIPYSEPCFGNLRYRNLGGHRTFQEKDSTHKTEYHKDSWHKGCVGVVYEVSASDFAHIIATEGGGASYQDVLIDCYTLSQDPSEPVPLNPTGTPLKAHTLFSPDTDLRSDGSYAQPSARYMKLLTDGAYEHNLPSEYRTFLSQIRPYTVSTASQQLGAWIFMAVWGSVLGIIWTGAGKMFLRPDGTYPEWYAKFLVAVFTAAWNSYDNWFKPLFGDGERSISDGGKDMDGSRTAENVKHEKVWNEKTPLLNPTQTKSEWAEPGTASAEEMV